MKVSEEMDNTRPPSIHRTRRVAGVAASLHSEIGNVRVAGTPRTRIP